MYRCDEGRSAACKKWSTSGYNPRCAQGEYIQYAATTYRQEIHFEVSMIHDKLAGNILPKGCIPHRRIDIDL